MLAVALTRVNAALGERQVPLTGVMGAFIFAAQMINFPIIGGTSGHLLGGALAAITLGPWAAMIVMTSVVGLQALLFQDGGLLALGANIFNMGLVTAVVGYGLYRASQGRPTGTRLAVAGGAAWLSVMAAALLTSLELWLSGTTSLEIVVPAMLGVHALIGIGEAVITMAALAFLLRTRPDVLERHAASNGRGWVVAGLGVALAVVLLAPLASQDPDGLERVAEDLGFLTQSQEAPYTILPDYTIPGLDQPVLSTVVAGSLGLLLTALLILAIVWIARRAASAVAAAGRSTS
jgi:cobalt/nickel transport system permease protein